MMHNSEFGKLEFIQTRDPNKFNLEHSTGSHSIVTFLAKPVFSPCFVDNTKHRITGYCSYHHICTKQGSVVGLAFYSFRDKTVCLENQFKVLRDVKGEGMEQFVPNFSLEKLGIMCFVSTIGSVIAIPTYLSTDYLIEV